MTYEIIDNIEVPATTATRTRTRGAFAQALDTLAVDQGFLFDCSKELKKLYPAMSPSKFPSTAGMSKKFKVWKVSETQAGVKRLADVPARA